MPPDQNLAAHEGTCFTYCLNPEHVSGALSDVQEKAAPKNDVSLGIEEQEKEKAEAKESQAKARRRNDRPVLNLEMLTRCNFHGVSIYPAFPSG